MLYIDSFGWVNISLVIEEVHIYISKNVDGLINNDYAYMKCKGMRKI